MASRTAIALRSLVRAVTVAAGWQLAQAQAGAAAPSQDPARPVRRSGAQILRAAGVLRDPATRKHVADELDRYDRERRGETQARASRLGLPLRGSLTGGGGWELMGFEGDQPIYFTTLNINAAIATGANLLQAAPYAVNGDGGTIGVWDEGAARVTHREFGGRVTSMDGAAVSIHSTHVIGTVCAAGVEPLAKGMAPAVRVDSYDWANAPSEMAQRGAAYPGETGKINISNHSYGPYAGWVYTASAVYTWLPTFTWYGSGADAAAVETDFGKYDTFAQEADSLASSLPYYLTFWAAGNDRGYINGVKLVNGSAVALSPGGEAVSYDASLHPPSDDTYRGGYDTMSGSALAKNVVGVGSVIDLVTDGQRDLSKAKVNSWSSWGPADDGRIKPDLVANGYSLYSCTSGSDASYGGMNGTSQASPSAAGTAQLLLHLFGTLFANHSLRASTLKALLIHTADDCGNAGPDYAYGWGLINAKAAADLLQDYRTHPGTRRVAEDRVATSRTGVSFSFVWDGAGPIRATLCWTDPAGEATGQHDLRTPRLVNNLDLRVMGPDGTVYQPWVMPFVGDWTTNTLAAPATTGSNTTDNVEQVLVASPGMAGTYTARVTFSGPLANGSQSFSLVLSGAADGSAAPAPLLTAATPSTGAGEMSFALTGDRFMLGADVRLTRAGQPDVPAAAIEVLGDTVTARMDTTGMARGWWNLALTNPDGQTAVLANAFVLIADAGSPPRISKGTVVSLR